MCADAEQECGDEVLEVSTQAVRRAYADIDVDLQEAMERGEEPVLDIAVSYDGTWMKRGFTSLFGVGVAIDILTGLVVDFEVLSKYCHACELQASKGLPQAELDAWRLSHREACCINHTGSSKSMEQVFNKN